MRGSTGGEWDGAKETQFIRYQNNSVSFSGDPSTEDACRGPIGWKLWGHKNVAESVAEDGQDQSVVPVTVIIGEK